MGPRKDPRYTILVTQKVPASESPPGSPTGPYGERYPHTGRYYVSLNISLFIFPSESLVREPAPCSLTGSSWTVILCHQSHWSVYSPIHSFIHSFMYVCQSPQKGVLPHMGRNIRRPTQTEGLHTMGCGLAPQGNR